jgi:hypothetical protein
MPCLTGRGERGFSLTEKAKKGDGTAGRRRLGVEAVAQPRIRALHSPQKTKITEDARPIELSSRLRPGQRQSFSY